MISAYRPGNIGKERIVGRPKKHVSLARAFLTPRILTLQVLCNRLNLSRASVIRRLNEHGYYSSYNWSGKFLTIREVANFDRRGLWSCKGARFSTHGTLKNTTDHFVNSSEAGMTHEELVMILGVRTHNTLLDLVREDRVQRRKLGSTFVYLSRKRSLQRKQVRRRESLLKKRHRPRATSRQKIATLLELIKDPKATRQDIVRRCRRTGVVIPHEVVDAIFETYELDKKRAQ